MKPIFVVLLTFTAAACGHDGVTGHTHEVATSDKNEVNISVQGNYRIIQSNGLPDHETGRFPNRGNPNSIRPQQHRYRVLLNPVDTGRVTPLGRGAFGVAVNGVPLHPGTAEFWGRDPRGWNYEAMSGKINLGLDQNNAHVQPTGNYHYHGIPHGLIDVLTRHQGDQPSMVFIGYAADGFPIYGPWAYADAKDPESELRKMKSSYRLKQGERPNGPGGRYDGTFVQDWEYVPEAGDLDMCNGRTGVTPEYPEGTYYYLLTEDYPFIPRNFRGTPDPSFDVGPPGPPPRRGGRPGPPPNGRPPF